MTYPVRSVRPVTAGDIEGTVAVSNGGTGQTTALAAGLAFEAALETTLPASSSTTGSIGQWHFTAPYLHVVVDTDTWIRVAVESNF